MRFSQAKFRSATEVYTVYDDPRRGKRVTRVMPAIKVIPIPELQRLSGMSSAAVQAIRAGRRPHPTNQEKLQTIYRELTGTASCANAARAATAKECTS